MPLPASCAEGVFAFSACLPAKLKALRLLPLLISPPDSCAEAALLLVVVPADSRDLGVLPCPAAAGFVSLLSVWPLNPWASEVLELNFRVRGLQ